MHAVGAATQTVELTVRADRSPGIVDITDVVARHVSRTAIVYGIAHVFCRHTTCGVLVNELEDGLAEDLAAAMARLVPERYFAHDDMTRRTQNLQGPDERPNGSAHVKQMLFGATSQTIPVVDTSLALGRWQRLLFIELDEPRERKLLITVFGT